MLRLETRGRARALQLLYAWEIQDGHALETISRGVARLTGPAPLVLDFAEELAARVIANVEALDRETSVAAENWRISRIGVIERNILRIAIQELSDADVPPKVVLDEAVRLAQWFGGAKSAPFVNGVLDRVAHALGRL